MKWKVIMSVFSLVTVMPAYSASFDCSKAQSFAEKQICSNPALSHLDEVIAAHYGQARGSIADPQRLRTEQINWLSVRDSCHDAACLEQTMSQRVDVLRALYDRTVSAPNPIPSPSLQAQQEDNDQRSDEVIVEKTQTVDSDLDGHQSQTGRMDRPEVKPGISSYGSDISTTGPLRNHPSLAKEPATTTLPPGNQVSELPIWKYVVAFLGFLTIISMVLHRQEKLTIYIDYTDALITNLLPVMGGALYLLMSWMEIPLPYPSYAGWLLVALAVIYAGYASYRANGFTWRWVMSFLSKLTLTAAFALLMAMLWSGRDGVRRQGETRRQAESRIRRQRREANKTMLASIIGYVALTAWLCRYQEFTSVSACLRYDPDVDSPAPLPAA